MKLLIQNLSKAKPWVIPGFLALLGGSILYQSMHQYQKGLLEVLIATHPIPQGDLLTDQEFESKWLQKENLPMGAILASEAGKLLGQRVVRPIGEKALILWSDLNNHFAPQVPASRITPGYRAMAINVNELSSAGQAIRPGDHVDLISVLNNREVEGSPTSMVLLQNVTVLNIGTAERKEKNESYSSVTLMVLPKEVNVIALASQSGSLMLSLRNPDDINTPKDLPMVDELQMVETAFRNSIQDERNHNIEIIRGGKSSLN